MTNEWRRDEYTISNDPRRIEVDVVHGYLERSYWAPNIPRDVVERSIQHSMCFGLYKGERQVGFARVVTDRATFAWIGDVFVLEEERGRGLAKWLMSVITSAPELKGLRRWMLATRDAHGLYAHYGFTPVAHADRFMERWDPDVYRGSTR